MKITINPTITFNHDDRDTFTKAYQWLLDMDEDEFNILNDDVNREYPRCDLNKLFEMLDEFTDYMNNRPE